MKTIITFLWVIPIVFGFQYGSRNSFQQSFIPPATSVHILHLSPSHQTHYPQHLTGIRPEPQHHENPVVIFANNVFLGEKTSTTARHQGQFPLSNAMSGTAYLPQLLQNLHPVSSGLKPQYISVQNKDEEVMGLKPGFPSQNINKGYEIMPLFAMSKFPFIGAKPQQLPGSGLVSSLSSQTPTEQRPEQLTSAVPIDQLMQEYIDMMSHSQIERPHNFRPLLHPSISTPGVPENKGTLNPLVHAAHEKVNNETKKRNDTNLQKYETLIPVMSAKHNQSTPIPSTAPQMKVSPLPDKQTIVEYPVPPLRPTPSPRRPTTMAPVPTLRPKLLPQPPPFRVPVLPADTVNAEGFEGAGLGPLPK